MERTKDYQWILEQYPPVITKEQLYKICHISKRTASHLLENGLIPCQGSGKKTRKYKIATIDLVDFLEKRADAPGSFAAPIGWYKNDYGKEVMELSPEMTVKLRAYFESLMSPYFDVLSVKEVGEITGYSSSAVTKWCGKNYLHHFYIRRKFFIPKPSLLDYMMGGHFRGIRFRSQKHLAYMEKLKSWE